MIEIKMSVRNLIERSLRSGDIDDSYRSMSRGLEGTLGHQKVQKSYGEGYQTEVSLDYELDHGGFRFKLQGRADGIYSQGGRVFIEEIKTSRLDLARIDQDHNPLHWAQVKFYGYIYMEEKQLEEIELKLTYFQLDREESKEFYKSFTREELGDFVHEIMDLYIGWARLASDWAHLRDQSIRELAFPFRDYRRGQREMAVAVYRTIEEGRRIFIQAATGIGKTMSTIFPGLKAMAEGRGEKIFYLTAKTISRQSPLRAYEILGQEGLRLKTLVITSKEKICPNGEVSCNPQDCKYAWGHFDRVNDCIRHIFKEEDLFSRQSILDYSQEHQVCPFELSLDLADFSDLIICDYNYLFDPQVQLKRFFEIDKTDYIFLIDEAHNLVDRARLMYSAEIGDREILEALDLLGTRKDLVKALTKLLDGIDSLGLDLEDSTYSREYPDALTGPLNRAISRLDKYLAEEGEGQGYDQLRELFFRLLAYRRIGELYDDHYTSSYEFGQEERLVRLNCLDPSYLLSKIMDKARATVLFSATLSPLDYYMDILGGREGDYHMLLASPFARENLAVNIISSLSTKYRERQYSYQALVDYIGSLVDSRRGNYLVFFPSYSYMEAVYDLYLEERGGQATIIQARTMTEVEREDFLQEFKRGPVLGFAVLGGIFSEAIDLVGDSLIGAMIVGVGLPGLSFENNMIRDYYNQKLGSGFDYAYSYPGMNKVLQAAGRVIRSSEDRGVIVLIDSRYAGYKYRSLLPRAWRGYSEPRSLEDFRQNLTKFWEKS